ncbi:Alpha/Beta hydrolase protein [Jimgerdemannia flammicorona]|uniref:Alpha/Beta hydrolase protein n=1 Tax=Jimgerdemannia flammicorona TaxID=994334 RepID=A0A433QLY8_9FUNG|nr:Alpha/Beta hydrolase protein [Jimgerdemannia flammicorona]
MTLTIKKWFASGTRVPLTLPSGKPFEIFYKVLPIPTKNAAENGNWVTMVHGFPTSSFDWIPVIESIRKNFRQGTQEGALQCLVLDLLGFGESDKPNNHTYSIYEQADIIIALWRHLGITTTKIVAHDYGVSVMQEVLARLQEAFTPGVPAISHLVFLNCGFFPDLHRPILVQKLLLNDWIGPAIPYVITKAAFSQQMASVISPEHPLTAEEMHELWIGIENRGGTYIYHRLIRYIEDRKLNQVRWERSLRWVIETNLGSRGTEVEGVASRVGFIWGMVDPVSGAHVAEYLHERYRAFDLSQCFYISSGVEMIRIYLHARIFLSYTLP